MNLLTPGIILYSFYLSTCMDSSDSDEDGDGDGDSMLPPHQRSPMFEGTLGGSFSKPYSKEELEGKFPGLKSGKGPKGKGPGKPKPPPGPNKDPMMPTDQEARGASGGPGPYQPGQYPQGQPGPYQTGPYPYPQGQPGPYPVQTPGGYGQPGKGPAYPPDPYGASGGYGPPGHGPAYPPDPYGAAGATGGYGGGASGGDGGPGQPTDPPGPSGPSSGPPTQAPDGTKLGPVDAKTAKNDDHTNVDEFRAGKNNHRHRRITPKHGHGFNFITYDGLRVWVMQGPEYAIEVLLFPLGFGEKTLEIKFSDGSKKIYKKGGNAKPWKEKD